MNDATKTGGISAERVNEVAADVAETAVKLDETLGGAAGPDEVPANFPEQEEEDAEAKRAAEVKAADDARMADILRSRQAPNMSMSRKRRRDRGIVSRNGRVYEK